MITLSLFFKCQWQMPKLCVISFWNANILYKIILYYLDRFNETTQSAGEYFNVSLKTSMAALCLPSKNLNLL